MKKSFLWFHHLVEDFIPWKFLSIEGTLFMALIQGYCFYMCWEWLLCFYTNFAHLESQKMTKQQGPLPVLSWHNEQDTWASCACVTLLFFSQWWFCCIIADTNFFFFCFLLLTLFSFRPPKHSCQGCWSCRMGTLFAWTLSWPCQPSLVPLTIAPPKPHPLLSWRAWPWGCWTVLEWMPPQCCPSTPAQRCSRAWESGQSRGTRIKHLILNESSEYTPN